MVERRPGRGDISGGRLPRRRTRTAGRVRSSLRLHGAPFPQGSLSMDSGRIAELLQEVAETHHRVYRITDGDDPDWASWYAAWLIDLSELPTLLGRRPVRSELVYLLVLLDREYTERQSGEPWTEYYARRIAEDLRG
jgi:hypothetical protein